MDSTGLLERCAMHLQDGVRDAADEDLLRQWNAGTQRRIAAFAQRLLALPPHDWDDAIQMHPAHRHAWYAFVRDSAGADDMAGFLLENRHFPPFIPMLQRIREVQVFPDAVLAVDENIDDEHQPVPHIELIRAMMTAVKLRARPDLQLSSYPALVDRTLVFYYGYFCDPWHLVGSLFATERMGTHRVRCMGEALHRMGLDEREMKFITVHSVCDDHHAEDWLDRVIVPSAESDARLATAIATGIAACLETSADYLDVLLTRATVAVSA